MRRRDPVEILDKALAQIGEVVVPPGDDPAPHLVRVQEIAASARLRAGRLRATQRLAQRPVVQDRH